jgi:hypothetical protein
MLILVLFIEFQEEIMYLFCSVSLSIRWITVRNNVYVVLTWNVEDIACACVINLDTGIALCLQLKWRTTTVPVLTSVTALYTQLIWRTIIVPYTDIWYCVHMHMIMADCHCARVLTFCIALYKHLATAYAISRPVLHPAIAIGTFQSSSCLSVTSFGDGQVA